MVTMSLRIAGENATRLAEALAGLELAPGDRLLTDRAAELAKRLDTVTDERLRVRYESQFTRVVVSLTRRSDANLRRRLAEEARKPLERPGHRPLAEFRARSRFDREDREQWELQNARRAQRLRAKGLSDEEVAAKMKVSPLLIPMWLKLLDDHAGKAAG
jgi:hypothetical protein